MLKTSLPALALAVLVAALPAPLSSQKPAEAKAEGGEKPKPAAPPGEKLSRSQHRITLDGRAVPYTATAGNYLLAEEDGTAKASIFFIAYTRDGTDDPGRRPVTFSFNGGPGAAAVWVNLGAFGPKKVAMDEEGFPLPPPGRLVDNEFSVLDLTDLVFIDPVSTGYSRAVPGEDPKQFHGLSADVEAVGEFIRLWLTRNQRWASPKFIAGESYGTTRAAALASHLQERHGMYLNGVMLISPVLNWQNQEFDVGNDLAAIVHLPSYAATAWYHKRLPPDLSGDLRPLLDEVEAFALGDYARALLQGDRLAADERRAVAERVARYTGLSPDYVERSHLRPEIFRFTKELLRREGKTVGRLDSRFTGSDRDSAGESPEYDPSLVAVMVGYVALINDHIRRDLGYESDLAYEALARVWPWRFEDHENRYVNTAESLRRAMTRNPSLKVLIPSGYYDLATPYFDADFTARHLGLPPELRGNVRVTHYQSGHMMYIRRADHRQLRRDVAEFIASALP